MLIAPFRLCSERALRMGSWKMQSLPQSHFPTSSVQDSSVNLATSNVERQNRADHFKETPPGPDECQGFLAYIFKSGQLQTQQTLHMSQGSAKQLHDQYGERLTGVRYRYN